MEKKNTILLTVIAIATLLVAVVGATFAYFTATVTTDNNANNTTTVTTYALPTVIMDMGDEVTSSGVYPGAKFVKAVTVTGSCPATGNCQDVPAVIEIDATIATEFGSDVTWYLYKGTQNADGKAVEMSCEVPGTDSTDGHYTSPTTCTGVPESHTSANATTPAAIKAITSPTSGYIATGNATGKTEVEVVVNDTTKDAYYLVLDYKNNTEADQNNQQNKTFSVKLNFKEKTTPAQP